MDKASDARPSWASRTRPQREGGPGGHIPGRWTREPEGLTSRHYIAGAVSEVTDLGVLRVCFELDLDDWNPENRDAVIAEIRRRLDATGVSDG